MTSRVVQSMIEPSIVTVPLFRTDTYTASPRAVSTFTTLATKTITTVATTLPATAVVTGSAASLPTSTGIPPLPSAFDSPLATGKEHTPAVAVATLVAVVICALILLLALSYFIFLRFRGECPNCPQYQDELNKWKNGDLKPIVPAMVRERMRAWDEEKGGINLQAQMYKDRIRQHSLACLEGRTQDSRTLSGWTLEDRADSVWSNEAVANKRVEEKDFDKGKEQVKDHIHMEVDLREPLPAHLVAAVARLGSDEDATLVNPALRNPDFSKSHSTYIREVYAPREQQRMRKLQEAADKPEIERFLDIASDRNNRESVQKRAIERVNQLIVGRDVREAEMKEKTTAPRQDGKSRFKEHLSWETKNTIDY